VPLALAVGGARLIALGNEPHDWQQQPLVRRASVALAVASPDTADSSMARAWLNAHEDTEPACRGCPDSREFELALGTRRSDDELRCCSSHLDFVTLRSRAGDRLTPPSPSCLCEIEIEICDRRLALSEPGVFAFH
jgi:hypothetical protein